MGGYLDMSRFKGKCEMCMHARDPHLTHSHTKANGTFQL